MLDPVRSSIFAVRSYYQAITPGSSQNISWKSILKVKVPAKSNFFSLGQQLGGKFYG